jgi:hypothetical protein
MRGWQRSMAGVVGVVFWLGTLLGQVAAQTPPAGRLSINHKGFTRPQPQGQPLIIEATITSPAGIRKAEVFCRAAGGRDFTAVPMQLGDDNVYRALVPDWMTAGAGVEYYIAATDQAGRSASQGFVGFPLIVRLLPAHAPTPEEKVKELENALETIRKSKETTPIPGGVYSEPQLNRNR